MPWKVKGNRRVETAPLSPLWATDTGDIGQIGCIYTAQGFEYSWNGVILGPDIVARKGKFITDQSKNTDKKNLPPETDEVVTDQHIRNIYKVLLTRGMRGTIIYSVNEETREFLAELIKPAARQRG